MDTATTLVEALGGWDNISNLERASRASAPTQPTPTSSTRPVSREAGFDVVIAVIAVQVARGPDSRGPVEQMNASQ